MVESALARKGITVHKSIYTPLVTLCVFLSQVHDPGHPCYAAVAQPIVRMAMNGRKPCSPDTGA
jgi:hypothetical protein